MKLLGKSSMISLESYLFYFMNFKNSAELDDSAQERGIFTTTDSAQKWWRIVMNYLLNLAKMI